MVKDKILLFSVLKIQFLRSSVFFPYRRVFGSMMGGTEDDSGSLDSDSDLILDGEAGAVGGAMMDSDDDDDELEVNEMAAESLKNRKSAKVTAGGALGNPAGDSDDDF